MDAALPNSGTQSERSASAAIVANRVQRHAAERNGAEQLSRIGTGGSPVANRERRLGAGADNYD